MIPGCRRAALLVLTLACAGAGFGDPPDYNVPCPVDPDAGLETKAWKALGKALGSAKVKKDGPLIQAARDLCVSVGGSAAGGDLALDPEMAREALLGRGVTDAGFAPLVMSGSGADVVLAAWTERLGDGAKGFAGRHVGLGARQIDGRWFLAAIAVERVVVLDPFPRKVETGCERKLSGRKVSDVEEVEVVVASPAGDVWSPTVSLDGGAFEATVDLGRGDGVYMVEVLGDTGFGPRVLNLFPVRVGQGEGVAQVVLGVPWREGPARNAWMLFDLVNADRLEHGLSDLEPDPELAAVALDHSRDMRDAGFFGHVSPDHGSIEDRTDHIGGLKKVSEVIALASSPQRAFGNLLSSPAHAAILRDPALTHMGVGKVRTAEGMLFTVVLGRR